MTARGGMRYFRPLLAGDLQFSPAPRRGRLGGRSGSMSGAAAVDCLRSDLELNGALGLVLDDDGACGHLVAVAYVLSLEADQVASAQLTVNAEVEESQFANPALHLQPDTQGPDVLKLERSLLPDELPLVPRLAMNGIVCSTHDGLPSS